MHRSIAILPVVACLVAACAGSSATPAPSLPVAPPAQPGWTMLGSVAGIHDTGVVGLQVTVAGRALALDVACYGDGTLAVSYGGGGETPPSGQPGWMFACATDGADGRVELPAAVGSGEVTFTAGFIRGTGSYAPGRFVIAVEQKDQ